jgi:hypothetical protein
MFLDASIIAFKFDSFVFFSFLWKVSMKHFFMKWIIDLNNDIHHLAFECQTNLTQTQAQDSNTWVKYNANKDILKIVVASVKFQYLEVASKLMVEL